MMNLTGSIIENKYSLLEKLSEGSRNNVYRAAAIHGQESVAVKLFFGVSADPKIRLRFQTELETLAVLNHPGVVRILASGQLDEVIAPDTLYLVMELLPERSLDQLACDRLSADQCVSVISQLCAVLAYLHREGIVHGDIKAQHVIITDESKLTLKLIDFGLSRILGRPETIGANRIQGTFEYMAPEQMGLIDRPVDARSDLYAVGIIFYEILCGCRPFTAKNLSELFHAQIAYLPPPPSSCRSGIAPVLDKIVMRLLAKEPQYRYQSAEGLLNDLARYAGGATDFQVGRMDQPAKLPYMTRTIGREEILSQLKNDLDAARKGCGGCILLSGEPGIGKTRIVAEFRRTLATTDIPVLEGRCLEKAGASPWGLFRQVFAGYMKYFQIYPKEKKQPIAEKLKREIGDMGGLITQLFPTMRQILGTCPEVIRLDPEKENLRACIVAARVLVALSEAEGGLVFMLEDLQWSDSASLNLLEEIARYLHGSRILILGTFRDNALPQGHPLQAIDGRLGANNRVRRIAVTPFDTAMMKTLVDEFLGSDFPWAAPLGRFLCGQCAGNPFFAAEMIQHLIADGILGSHESGWMLDQKRLNAAAPPSSLLEIISSRIDHLSSADRHVLCKASVIGRDIDFDLLVRLEDGKASVVRQVIQEALTHQILEKNETAPDRIQFAHDVLREAFYAMLNPDIRIQLHLSVGRAMEQKGAGGLDALQYQLAYHFIQGGDDDKILAYAWPAARKARQAYAYDDALTYFKAGAAALEKQCAGSPSDALRVSWLQCNRELAETYIDSGRNGDAIALFERILPELDRESEKVHAYFHLARAHYFNQDLKASEACIRKGLALMGERLPQGRVGIILGTVKELLSRWFYCLAGRMRKALKDDSVRDAAIMRANFCHCLFLAYHTDELWKTLRVVLRWLNISERFIGPSRHLAWSLMHYAFLWIMLGFKKRAMAHGRRARHIIRQLEDAWLMAQSTRLFMLLSIEMGGRFRESIRWCEESIAFFSATGEFLDMITALYTQCINYFELGEIARALQCYETAFQYARNRHDEAIFANVSITATLYADLGDFGAAEKAVAKCSELVAYSNIPFSKCINMLCQGRLKLLSHDFEQAIKHFETALDIFQKNSMIPHIVSVAYNLYAEALLGEFLSGCHARDPKQNRRHLARARKACRTALRKNRRFHWHCGQAIKIYADYLAAAGKQNRAEKFYQKAFGVFQGYQQRYKLALARYDYGKFLEGRGRTGQAFTQFRAAYSLFDQLGLDHWKKRVSEKVKPAGPANGLYQDLIQKEKRNSILAYGKNLSEFRDIEELMSGILNKAMEITGAHQGGLFISDADFDLVELKTHKCLSPNDSFAYSQNIVDQVYNSGLPAILDNASLDSAYSTHLSVERNAFKSILCTPVRYNDLINGVCYLQNSLAVGVFTSRDADLLEQFLAYGAIAIERMLLARQVVTFGTARKTETAEKPCIDSRLSKVLTFINENYLETLTREELADRVGVTPDYFGKTFKLQTGKSLRAYLNQLRIEHAHDLLLNTEKKVIDIAFESGFESLRTFNRLFFRTMGDTPSNYKQRQADTSKQTV